MTEDEIQYFIRGFKGGEIPDYQVDSWAMAVLNGMSAKETTALTLAMAESGETLDLSDHVSVVVD